MISDHVIPSIKNLQWLPCHPGILITTWRLITTSALVLSLKSSVPTLSFPSCYSSHTGLPSRPQTSQDASVSGPLHLSSASNAAPQVCTWMALDITQSHLLTEVLPTSRSKSQTFVDHSASITLTVITAPGLLVYCSLLMGEDEAWGEAPVKQARPWPSLEGEEKPAMMGYIVVTFSNDYFGMLIFLLTKHREYQTRGWQRNQTQHFLRDYKPKIFFVKFLPSLFITLWQPYTLGKI